MNKYIAEVSFADRSDLSVASHVYNIKAQKFQSGLRAVQDKYFSYLSPDNINLGVETIDNFGNCTIKLKSLSAAITDEIRTEVIALFNTTWSQ
jgi:hypothetical protein